MPGDAPRRPRTTAVLAIDPGLDRTGAALLSLDVRRKVTVHATMRCLTDPALDLGDRCRLLAECGPRWIAHLRQLAGLEAPVEHHIVLEVPEKSFTYTTHSGVHRTERDNANSLALFWQGLGAVRAGLSGHGIAVTAMASSTIAKKQRQAIFAPWLASARNEDERDAIVLGCRLLFGDVPRAT
jgi:hypothetical protein